MAYGKVKQGKYDGILQYPMYKPESLEGQGQSTTSMNEHARSKEDR